MKNDINKKSANVLVLGAHPDDFELGCAGTIIKYRANFSLHIAIFSDRMDTGEARNMKELNKSLSVLDIPRSRVDIFDIPTRIFYEYRAKIRHILLSLQEKHNIDIVFCPSLHDLHQDHVALAEETLRIFREKSVLSYEILRSSSGFNPQLSVELNEKIVNLKLKACSSYLSQLSSTRSGGYYFKHDVLKGHMFTRGGQYGFKFAEAFEVHFLKF